MIDENLNEYLNMSIIDYFVKTKSNATEVQQSLDSLGFKVGYSIIERMVPDTIRFVDDVSVMKYICKEYWTNLFSKQIDNLRTNNSGIFVLQDNNFRLLSQLSTEEDSAQLRQYYLTFACGLLRGSLANFGYNNVVISDAQTLPICKFQINLLAANQPGVPLINPVVPANASSMLSNPQVNALAASTANQAKPAVAKK